MIHVWSIILQLNDIKYDYKIYINMSLVNLRVQLRKTKLAAKGGCGTSTTVHNSKMGVNTNTVFP